MCSFLPGDKKTIEEYLMIYVQFANNLQTIFGIQKAKLKVLVTSIGCQLGPVALKGGGRFVEVGPNDASVKKT